jgi:ADP-heptose:LPS heptosyltransferase
VRERLRQLAAEDSPELFREIIEPWSDAFEPPLCDRYAEEFLPVIADLLPQAGPRRASRPRRFTGPDPADIFVLSRVTLGADVAVTSVILAAAAQRFPHSRIHFTGPRKNHELLSDFEHVPLDYGGGLRSRLTAALLLRDLVDRPRSIVIDPDSRLTQLGLIPVCPDDRYFFWESRSYHPESDAPLSTLAAKWMQEIFDAPSAAPFVTLVAAPVAEGWTAVSLGVGGNPAKRVGDEFESQLLSALVRRGDSIVVDHGAGGEESLRIRHALDAAQPERGQVREWRGSYAPFAATIAASRLYVGYDSVGQHVAAAAGVPLVTIFNGYPNERFRLRWRPSGPGPVRVVTGPDFLPGAIRALQELEGVR